MFSGCRVCAAVRAAGPCNMGLNRTLLEEKLHLEHETDTLVTGRDNGLSLLLTSRARFGGREGSDANAVDDTGVTLVLSDEGSRTDVPSLEVAVGRARSDEVEIGGGVRGERSDGLLITLALAS